LLFLSSIHNIHLEIFYRLYFHGFFSHLLSILSFCFLFSWIILIDIWFICLCSTRFLIQGLVLARWALYNLNHSMPLTDILKSWSDHSNTWVIWNFESCTSLWLWINCLIIILCTTERTTETGVNVIFLRRRHAYFTK
jgi:hypothetical protein